MIKKNKNKSSTFLGGIRPQRKDYTISPSPKSSLHSCVGYYGGVGQTSGYWGKVRDKKTITLFGFYLILGSILFLLVILDTQSVLANSVTDSLENAANIAGLKGETDIQKIVSGIIDIVLGLLGLIFLILILVGGFQWMTSAGEPEKIKTAKGLLTNAVIGLLIISAFYAITQFVFSLIGVKTVISG